MGKLSGIIKLEGTLDGLTFYKSKDGHLVRTKGGVNKKRIMTDPAFARTRENLSEFGQNAKAGKLIRDAVGLILNNAKDSKLSSRMLQLMNSIKNLDATSERGKRKVQVGLSSIEGKQRLKGFDFNIQAPMASVLHANYTLDPATGTVTMSDFVPEEQLSKPATATHFSMRTAFVVVDLATGQYTKSYSPRNSYPIQSTEVTFDMIPEAVPTGSGIHLHLLLIEFFQEVNGVSYSLKSGSYNTLNIVEVL
ncbi:hypothetical protein [Flavobacterium turcicum]|uniref:Uncharacterized protein n=1 Tax=Flavobacterium turcicum TaxID=2764718 RepID=A0ABR7JGM1_9FLAO|nr:hypothetical protein [Flavobacterium turcicum]MBC5863629.1 hypothetical protein [Flavobacterium turcicum]NHL02421.1 hypothetical protein [Flavobacterium turcicum]